MARRSTARGGGGPEEADAPPERAPAQRVRRPVAGAGGRWWVWVGRAVLWAFIIVVIFNGIWHPLREGFATPSDEEPQQEESAAYPETAAAAFATRFAQHYLNASTDNGGQEERVTALAEFVPDGEAESYATGSAELTGTDIEVVTVAPEDDRNAVVTLMADINGSPMSLDVPVYAQNASSLVVSGPPALLPPPEKAQLPEAPAGETDDESRVELEEILPDFFAAYADDADHLDRYLEEGASLGSMPGGTLTFDKVEDVAVPAASGVGEDDVRQATATVVWEVPGGRGEEPATLTQSYGLTVVKSDGQWYVRDIQGAAPGGQ